MSILNSGILVNGSNEPINLFAAWREAKANSFQIYKTPDPWQLFIHATSFDIERDFDR